MDTQIQNQHTKWKDVKRIKFTFDQLPACKWQSMHTLMSAIHCGSLTTLKLHLHSKSPDWPFKAKPFNFIPRTQEMVAYVRNDFSATRKTIYECRRHKAVTKVLCIRHHNLRLFSIYCNSDAVDGTYDC